MHDQGDLVVEKILYRNRENEEIYVKWLGIEEDQNIYFIGEFAGGRGSRKIKVRIAGQTRSSLCTVFPVNPKNCYFLAHPGLSLSVGMSRYEGEN